MTKINDWPGRCQHEKTHYVREAAATVKIQCGRKVKLGEKFCWQHQELS